MDLINVMFPQLTDDQRDLLMFSVGTIEKAKDARPLDDVNLIEFGPEEMEEDERKRSRNSRMEVKEIVRLDADGRPTTLYVLSDFEVGSASMSGEAKDSLIQLLKLVKMIASLREMGQGIAFDVFASTDSVGDDDVNADLRKERIDAFKDLVAMEVPDLGQFFDKVGRLETGHAFFTNSTERGRALNRSIILRAKNAAPVKLENPEERREELIEKALEAFDLMGTVPGDRAGCILRKFRSADADLWIFHHALMPEARQVDLDETDPDFKPFLFDGRRWIELSLEEASDPETLVDEVDTLANLMFESVETYRREFQNNASGVNPDWGVRVIHNEIANRQGDSNSIYSCGT